MVRFKTIFHLRWLTMATPIIASISSTSSISSSSLSCLIKSSILDAASAATLPISDSSVCITCERIDGYDFCFAFHFLQLFSFFLEFLIYFLLFHLFKNSEKRGRGN